MPHDDLLDLYLSDHFAGATAGLELARRMADAQGSPELAAIASEIEADRETLRGVMAAVAARPPMLKSALGWIAEKAGRLKLNDRVFGRSPLSSVLELEGLIAGVSAKLQLWRALGRITAAEPRLEGFDFESLAARAEGQRRRLEALHTQAVDGALRGP